MIKLRLPDCPAQLSEERTALTAEYQADNTKSVWGKPYIKKAVAAISNNKCIYSECQLNSESTYMEIDHFYPKGIYPDKVVEWGNLLPCCKKCNTTKNALDPQAIPIINPLVDTPKDYLYLLKSRYYSRNEKGKNTIDNLALNNREHFCNPRSILSLKIMEELEDLLEQSKTINWEELNTKRTRFINSLKGIMELGQPNSAYSANNATTILEDPSFERLKSLLQHHELWDVELTDLEKMINECALLR